MIKLKNPEDIEIMQEGGKILHTVLTEVMEKAQVGTSLIELDNEAEKLIIAQGGFPSFKKVPGYHWTLCTCINDCVVHGIPDDYHLKPGDVVSLDCGVFYKGFHTDSSWTKYLEGKDEGTVRFVQTGELALKKAIPQAKPGNYIYDISKTIQDVVEGAGFSVVRSLVGHGVGRELHEEPEVPGFVTAKRTSTPQITAGMVLAIEVIYNMGSPDVVYRGDDGWTIVTKDGKISGLFEATVAVTSHGCLLLT